MTGEETFLKRHFQGFYSSNKIAGPPEIGAREFGIGVFGRKISNRHLSFASDAEFNSFLSKEVPLFVSSSVALYKFPGSKPMESKQLFGADLVYEFDADDLLTECKQLHDSWLCPKCGKKGKGRQLMCDECGSPTKREEWFCPECLEAAKQRVFALLDFLENDFGFNSGISINFSGRAGYHVHVRSDDVRQLSGSARIELIDYLTANGLSIFSHFKKVDTFFKAPKIGKKVGWPQRILAELVELLQEANAEKIAVMGDISLAMAKNMLKKRDLILASIRERDTIPAFFGRVSAKAESKSDLFWQRFLQSIVAKLAPIDRQTSIDMNKIVRVPETLHGETGLFSTSLSREKLKLFKPFDDAVVLPKQPTVKVFITKSPSIYLAGDKLGPFEKEEAELPLASAIFLLGRGAAFLPEVEK